MKRTYSKDWCQGFCRTCGTSCADQCEDVHELMEEVEKAKLEASTDLISQEHRLGARNEILEKENARFREALINCRVERDEPDTVKFLVDEAFDVLEGGGLEVSATGCRVCGEMNPVGHDCKANFDLLRAENERLSEGLRLILIAADMPELASMATKQSIARLARAALEVKE